MVSPRTSHTNNFISTTVKCYCKDLPNLPLRHVEKFIIDLPVDNDNGFKKYIVIRSTAKFDKFKRNLKCF